MCSIPAKGEFYAGCTKRCLSCKNKTIALLKDEVSSHLTNDDNKYFVDKSSISLDNNDEQYYKLKNVKEGNHI